MSFKMVFVRGDYSDREIIDGIFSNADVRKKVRELSMGMGVLTLGNWVKAELRSRDVTLSEVMAQAEVIARG